MSGDLEGAIWRQKAIQLISILNVIPDDEWNVGAAASPDLRRFCAWGQLIHRSLYAEATILECLLGPFPGPLSDINNGRSGNPEIDKLPVPRLRIVKALTDISLGERIPHILSSMH